MEDRIQINGVWYVREDAIQDPIDHLESEENQMDVALFNGRVYESDLYCFEVTQILDDDGKPYDAYDVCDIEITDKRSKPFKVEHVDHIKWFIGVLENNPESMPEANNMFCEQGIAEFRSVISDLIDIGWLKR